MDLNKGVPTLFAYCEKLIWKFFFKFKQGTCPWMAFAWNFFGIFLIFFRGVCGANHLTGIYSISGLKYFLWPGHNAALRRKTPQWSACPMAVDGGWRGGSDNGCWGCDPSSRTGGFVAVPKLAECRGHGRPDLQLAGELIF